MGRRIIFLHPDLGLGGAERLVVDAALALKSKGHDVSFITSYHNKDHCFKETADGTLQVKVVGGWIPRQILGRFFALMAYLKMIYCALYIILFESNVDVVFCDLVSVCIPVLKLTIPRVIFYCHFPDQLLSKKEGRLKDFYRAPLNCLEEKTTNWADKLYVNSQYTRGVFKATFSKIERIPSILYPSINTSALKILESSAHSHPPVLPLPDNAFIFLSINRFERKKHVELAVNAMKKLTSELLPDTDEYRNRVLLVIAGGCDPRVQENVSYHDELALLVKQLQLEKQIFIVKSPSDEDKVSLLVHSDALVYTPPHEHFGIVPLEAMFFGKPVIACNSGGPTETVEDGTTGFLCDFDSEAFARAMARLVENPVVRIKMTQKSMSRFEREFSFEAFSNQLNSDIEALFDEKKDG